jgi:hypothetical protein
MSVSTPAAPRELALRKRDALVLLDESVDAWVASAGTDLLPCLVPLSYVWTAGVLLVATPLTNQTGRNLTANPRARAAVGAVRDVVMLHADVTVYTAVTVPDELMAAYVGKLGWDPRAESVPYGCYALRPYRMQAWREGNEERGRELMRGGAWLV